MKICKVSMLLDKSGNCFIICWPNAMNYFYKAYQKSFCPTHIGCSWQFAIQRTLWLVGRPNKYVFHVNLFTSIDDEVYIILYEKTCILNKLLKRQNVEHTNSLNLNHHKGPWVSFLHWRGSISVMKVGLSLIVTDTMKVLQPTWPAYLKVKAFAS